jgi:hypothetical protein
MKNLITIILISFFLAFQANAQAEKTLVKSVDLNGNIAVAAVFSGNTVVNEWDKDFVRVTTRIELTNSNSSILERLVSAGRYEVKVDEKNGEVLLSMPKVLKPVNLQGNNLIEKFSYEVMIPKRTSIRIEQPVSEGI